MPGDHWPSALDALAEGCGARGAALFAVDNLGMPFAIQRTSSVYSPEDAEYYVRELLHYDLDAWELLRQRTPRSLQMDEEVHKGSLDDLNQRPDYQWMMQTAGVLRRGGARLNDNPGWTDTSTLQFDASMDRIPLSTVRQAEAMLPHLAKAVELNRSFSILHSRYRAVLSALDHFMIGVCVTAQQGSVIAANREAKRIFDLGDGLTLGKDGHFRCANADTAARISASIFEAISSVLANGGTHETQIAVPRRSGSHPLLVEIAPLTDSVGEIEPHLKGAIIFIVDPDNPRPFSVDAVAQCFQLTPTECEVCALMVTGLTDVEIASRRSVSVETVRSQAKSIYRKTRTFRRAELIRLALSIVPPIEST